MRTNLQILTKNPLSIIILAASTAFAQTTPTVINVPDDPAPDQVLAGQILNLYDGGELDRDFIVNSNGTLNVYGGHIDDDLFADRFSTVNVSGGEVDYLFRAPRDVSVNISGGLIGYGFEIGDGTVVNIGGGRIDTSAHAYDGSVINVTGGTIGSFFDVNEGATVNLSQGGIDYYLIMRGTFNMTGGEVGGLFKLRDNGTAVVSGGRFGQDLQTDPGSSLTLIGGDFMLDGVPISGLENVGNSVGVNIPEDSTLTGTLSDGSVFIFTPVRGDDLADGTLTLQAAPVPNTPSHINVPTDPAPQGLRAGQTLTLSDGGTLPKYFAAVDASLNVTGGSIGQELEVSNTDVTVTGGYVSTYLAQDGTTVRVQGGEVFFGEYTSGSSAIISGGVVRGLQAGDDSVVTISGGSITDNALYALNGSKIDFHGGSFEQLRAEPGSGVTFHGGQFMLDGVPIQGLDSPGDSVIFDPPAGSILTGILSDGTVIALRSYRDNIAEGSLTLSRTVIPQTSQQVFDVPAQTAPRGLTAGQSIYLSDGGSLDYNFVAIDAVIEIEGGVVKDGMRLINSDLVINGGDLGPIGAHRNSHIQIRGGRVKWLGLADNSHAEVTGGTFDSISINNESTLDISGDPIIGYMYLTGQTVHLMGGTITSRILLDDDSVLEVHDGTISAQIDSNDNSRFIFSGGAFEGFYNGWSSQGDVLIRGGEIGGRFAFTNITLTISGGHIRPDMVMQLEDEQAALNLIGRSFTLDGVPLTTGMLPGETLPLTQRDVLLQGILADGSSIRLFLNSDYTQTGSFFPTDSNLTITLVPEPSVFVLIGVSMLSVLPRQRVS